MKHLDEDAFNKEMRLGNVIEELVSEELDHKYAVYKDLSQASVWAQLPGDYCVQGGWKVPTLMSHPLTMLLPRCGASA